jgi:hypothetical protein
MFTRGEARLPKMAQSAVNQRSEQTTWLTVLSRLIHRQGRFHFRFGKITEIGI